MSDIFIGEQNVDLQGPTVSAQSPAPGATEVALDASISFTILDDFAGTGVNVATLNVTVAGTPAITAGVFQAGFAGTITANGNGYDVFINPSVDFSYNQVVQVVATADDFASPPNPGIGVWSFSVVTATVAYIMRGVNGAGPNYVYWVSVGSPDPTGALAPIPGLLDIVVRWIDPSQRTYLNRAYRTPTSTYVYWLSAGVPDSTGTFAPVPAVELSDFVAFRQERYDEGV